MEGGYRTKHNNSGGLTSGQQNGNHSSSGQSQQQQQHKCDECNREFASKTTLTSHMLMAHGHAASHACTECGQMFGSRWILYRHKKKEHKDQYLASKPTRKHAIVCGKCNSPMPSVPILCKHLRLVHHTPAQIEEFTLNTIGEFENWKHFVESSYGFQFVIKRGRLKQSPQQQPQQNAGSAMLRLKSHRKMMLQNSYVTKTDYYICSKSGFLNSSSANSSDNQGQRSSWQSDPSNPEGQSSDHRQGHQAQGHPQNFYCSAFAIVRELQNRKIHVTACINHYGHDEDMVPNPNVVKPIFSLVDHHIQSDQLIDYDHSTGGGSEHLAAVAAVISGHNGQSVISDNGQQTNAANDDVSDLLFYDEPNRIVDTTPYATSSNGIKNDLDHVLVQIVEQNDDKPCPNYANFVDPLLKPRRRSSTSHTQSNTNNGQAVDLQSSIIKECTAIINELVQRPPLPVELGAGILDGLRHIRSSYQNRWSSMTSSWSTPIGQQNPNNSELPRGQLTSSSSGNDFLADHPDFNGEPSHAPPSKKKRRA